MAKYIVYVDNGKDIVYSTVDPFSPFGFPIPCAFDKTRAYKYTKFRDAKRIAERLGGNWKVEKVEE